MTIFLKEKKFIMSRDQTLSAKIFDFGPLRQVQQGERDLATWIRSNQCGGLFLLR